MRQKYRLFFWVTLILALSLMLAACERPVPDDGNTQQDTSTATDAGSDSDAATQMEETDTVDDSATSSEVAAETSEADSDESTPRVDAAEEASDEAEVSDEAAESEVAEETTESVTDEETAVAEETSETAEASEGESSDAVAESDTAPTTHTVTAGETLYRIGLRYNISWVTLAEFNGLDNANRIEAGQVLKIPPGETAAKVEPTPSPLTETTYAVQAGDNLYRIGLNYGISWVQIAEANGLVSPNQIAVGQVLKIPVDTPGPTPQFTHEVIAGETLLLISLHYGVPWPTIAEANNIGSPYVIFSGQTLVIPGG